MYRHIAQRSCGKLSTVSGKPLKITSKWDYVIKILIFIHFFGQVRGYSRLPANTREAGFGKFIVILTPFAVGGGVVAYAK